MYKITDMSPSAQFAGCMNVFVVDDWGIHDCFIISNEEIEELKVKGTFSWESGAQGRVKYLPAP